MAKNEGFMPEFLTSTNARSLRHIYKWADPNRFYKPSNRSNVYAYIRDALGLDDEFFKTPNYVDEDIRREERPIALSNKDVDALRRIVGEENVAIDYDTRLKASITKSNTELKLMHNRTVPQLVDAVVTPSLESEIIEILAYTSTHNITVVVGSHLVPKMCGNKTICIDLAKRYNKIVEFNEVDGYVKVQAGMYLLILENIMRNAPDNFKDYNVENRYTIGHFPKEAEECTLYDAASGIKYGMEAGYFGRFDEIVVGAEYLTVDGKVVNEYVEGAILSTLTMQLTRYYPHNNYGFSYMFRSWQEALNALREIMSRAGAVPMHIKLSDPKETEMLMRYYLLDDTIVDSLLRSLFKAHDGERCLMVGYSGGAYTASRLQYNSVKKIAKKYKGVSLTSILADAYVESRYTEMYAREAFADFGVYTDNSYHECAWSDIPTLHKELVETAADEHEFVRSRVIAPTKNGAVLEVVKMSIK